MKQFFRPYAFPLTIATLAVAFLVLFFLVPVLKVFGASLYDMTGKTLTLANYSYVLSNRFFLDALGNSLMIAAAAFALTIMIGVPFAFCVARLPIRRQSGVARSFCAAAGAAFFRQRLRACADVRTRGNRDRGDAQHWYPVGVRSTG